MRILREVGIQKGAIFSALRCSWRAEGTARSRENPEDCPRQTMVFKAAPTLRKCRTRPVFAEKIHTFHHPKNGAVIVRAVKGSTGLNELP